MLSILVCHSYYLRFDQKQLERGKPYPALATLQVAAMLRKAGHRVSFFDTMLADGVEEFDRRLRAVEPQLVLLYEDTFNFLSKMCLGAMRRAACDMIASAHRAGARVIAAGPDVSDAPGLYLRVGADVALIGEGLSALLEVLSRLDSRPQARSHELIEGVPGVASLSHNNVVTANGARVLPIPHYDGFAAWDLVDMDRYRAVWLKSARLLQSEHGRLTGLFLSLRVVCQTDLGESLSAAQPGRRCSGNDLSSAHLRSSTRLVCG